MEDDQYEKYEISKNTKTIPVLSKSPHGYFSPDNSMDKFQKTLWKIAIK